ncbi:MAG TPA: histidine kinase [Bacillus bacterium]|nr:histidine kinase [Bacillus sp. (in: firmicutes)]
MKTTDNPINQLIASNMYTRYSGILSLSNIPLFLVDCDGYVVLEFIPSPDFCTHLCRERGEQVCESYRSRFKTSQEGSFVCRRGLHNIYMPIKVEGEIVGYIAGMQVFSQETEYQKYMIDVQSVRKEKNAELEFIAKSIASLKTVEEAKMKIHEQICGHIARNISIDLSESASSANQVVERLSIEKEMLERKIIDLEAKNMSLVVNPHFLFNTLNCIARIAYFENSHSTEELIYCLSDLLRYNLKQEDQLHTIASEIDNIEKYLYIQKARFKDRLEYSIDVPEHIKGYRIPNMVIQPIVENALIHGITPKRDGGRITIQAEEKQNENIVIISVADNGSGFTKEALHKLQQPENKAGLGYWSTNNRLKQYYGKDHGLKIAKSDFSGSTITITIPAQSIGRY